jgi:glycosyltransferase involved in cell wall biosynthesis
MPDPRVTVVIPTRNRLRYLREAVKSVQLQNFQSWECIVVDDASDDGTADWLHRLEDDRIVFKALGERSERVRARNVGLRSARGDLILFLDDDDRITPAALDVLEGELSKDANAIAAVGSRQVFDDQRRRMIDRPSRHSFVQDVWPEVLFGWFTYSGQSVLRKTSLETVGGWGSQPSEDQQLWLALSLLGPVRFIPDIVLENRVHSGQRRPERAALREIQDRMRYEHVQQLLQDRQDEADAILHARRCFWTASESYAHDSFRDAKRALNDLARAAPSLIKSPLVGPWIRKLEHRVTLGSVLGPKVIDIARRGAMYGRRLARTDFPQPKERSL